MRVYLSSTLTDLVEEREAVRRVLSEDVVVRESYAADEHPLIQSVIRDVEGCDLYIGLIAHRYGFVPRGETRSITEIEYDAARTMNKPCLIFLKAEAEGVVAGEGDALRQAVQRFRRKVTDNHRPAVFHAVADLQLKVLRAVLNHRRGSGEDQPAELWIEPIDGAIRPNSEGQENRANGEFAADLRTRVTSSEPCHLLAWDLGCVAPNGVHAYATDETVRLRAPEGPRDLVLVPGEDAVHLATALPVDPQGVVLTTERHFLPRLPVQRPFEWDNGYLTVAARLRRQNGSVASQDLTLHYLGARSLRPRLLPRPPRLNDEELGRLVTQGFLSESDTEGLGGYTEEERYLLLLHPYHFRRSDRAGSEWVLSVIDALMKTLREHPTPPYTGGRIGKRQRFSLRPGERSIQLDAAPGNPSSLRITVQGFEVRPLEIWEARVELPDLHTQRLSSAIPGVATWLEEPADAAGTERDRG